MISHKLKEVLEIADTVTILRDGQTVCSLDTKQGEVTETAMVKHMVGREIDNIYPPREKKEFGETVLEVKNWTAYDPEKGKEILKDINFYVRKGEIVGFTGLMGSGRTELAKSLFGNRDEYRLSGEMKVVGKPTRFSHPREAINSGMAYVAEVRKGNGLILIQDVKRNTTLANLRAIAKNGIVNSNAEIVVATEYKNSLNIKTPSIEQKVLSVSGGNQQKVSLAKWLFVQPSVLMLDDPHRHRCGAKFKYIPS